MNNLREIDDSFIDEYIITHRNKLSKPTIGGTDWRFADIVAPAFYEILEIVKPRQVLEIGFNVGGSALMFLKINPALIYNSIDIVLNEKSAKYLEGEFKFFEFYNYDSKDIKPGKDFLMPYYDMVLIDGDHTEEGVRNDIEKSLLFNPDYLLFDDYRHPSHSYIEKIVTEDYKEKLEVVKVFEFNQCWQGYSFALCKVKHDS